MDAGDVTGLPGRSVMRRARLLRTTLIALSATTFAAGAARAEVFRDVAIGLAHAGFNFEGERNLLSGGPEFLVNRNFGRQPGETGTTVWDFGAWDLTLMGPVSLGASTGGRFLPQFDFGLSTALTPGGAPQPLAYSLNYDVGPQATRIEGTLLLDIDLSVNAFGFYDFDLVYSSRQDVSRRGRFADDDQTFDADVGPISFSGNIYADVLAVVTQPLFKRTGRQNIFASFSGTGSFSDLLTNSSQVARDQLLAGDGSVAASRVMLLAVTPLDETLLVPAASAQGANLPVEGRIVPEPTVLLLMLLGVPVLFRRRSRPHRAIRNLKL